MYSAKPGHVMQCCSHGDTNIDANANAKTYYDVDIDANAKV